jgi:hypothetical protein
MLSDPIQWFITLWEGGGWENCVVHRTWTRRSQPHLAANTQGWETASGSQSHCFQTLSTSSPPGVQRVAQSRDLQDLGSELLVLAGSNICSQEAVTGDRVLC